MTTPTWPADLPQQPLLTSPQIGAPIKAILRSEMDTGPAKTRPRVTAAVRPLSMTFAPLSPTQVGIFETFHETQLKFGALAFEIPHPITDTVTRVRFSTVDNQYSVRCIGRYAYELALRLEVLP